MTPERWGVVQEIFGRVSELPSEERDRVVHDSCPDPEIESEIRRLLVQLDEAVNFLECPPDATTALRSDVEEEAPRFQPGADIGNRFEVVRLLGRGGMGEVYEASDRSSGEHVALKTIRASLAVHPGAVARFQRELRRARHVTHENVCRLHEIFSVSGKAGQSLVFLTMELLHGETLSEVLRRSPRISVDEALRYANQIAAGLNAAHRAGVVHRDMKPGNVIITRTNGAARAVITDFGLALSSVDPESAPITRTLVGTPAYMAPEQLRGEPASPSSDIYSLGIIVCEMLFGRRPERGFVPAATPQEQVWAKAIAKCTAEDPSRRFESPADFLLALTERPARVILRRSLLIGTATTALAGIGWWTYGTRKRTITLAVLPFDSEDADTEHIEYTATDLLIGRLRRLQGFEIPGASAVRQFSGRSLPVRAIARSLRVDWLLSCRLKSAGRKLFIHARLIRGDGAPGPWEQSFEGGLEQLDRIAASIAAGVAKALQPALAQAALTEGPGTNNADAYDLYLRGRYFWNRRQRDDLLEARRLLESCVKLDPSFALGYCGLADTLSVLADYGQAPPADTLPLAKQAALKALNLNSRLADCHVSFAFATSLNDFDWFTAENSYLRAIELDPNHGLAHQWYSGLLARLSRPEDCLLHANEAIRQDALSIPANRNLATMLYFLRRYPEAIEQADHVRAMAPGFFGCRELLAESQARLGEKHAALATVDAMLGDLRTPGFTLAYVATTYAILGLASKAVQAIEDLTLPARKLSYQPVHVARAYSDLGRHEECFEWLEIAYAKRDTGLQFLPIYESFDGLRSDRRFQQFVERLKIVYPPKH